MKDLRITVVSSAVAAMFAAACSTPSPGSTSASGSDDTSAGGTGEVTQASVKCVGINSCKGTSECQSADGKSACQGQNECKGQGWITIPSEQECREKGGSVYVTLSDASASSPVVVDGAVSGSSGDAGPLLIANDASSSVNTLVHCLGINECKGQGSCAGAGNACTGHNACKGQGWIEVPSGECSDRGGTQVTG